MTHASRVRGEGFHRSGGWLTRQIGWWLAALVWVSGHVAATECLAQAKGGATDFIPAGAINNVFAGKPLAIVVEDAPGTVAYVGAIRDQFFPEADIFTDEQAVLSDLSGHNLLVYTTPDGVWFRRYAERLPMGYGEGVAWLQDQEFTGDHLRVIAAIRHPQAPERRAILYTAAVAADLIGINNLFHGPTEWLVADGAKVLAEGDYTVTHPLTVDQMIRDLDALVGTVLAVHPATLEGAPAELATAVTRARAAIREGMSRTDFWFLLQGVCLSLKDAHTAMTPPVSGERVHLPLRWLYEDGLIVSAKTDVLVKGDRVLAIGGHDETKLQAALSRLVPAENRWWVREWGEALLGDVAVLRLLGVVGGAPVPVTLERSGTTFTVRLAVSTELPQEDAPPWVRFTLYPRHDLAVFTLDACRPDDHYKGVLRDFFTGVHEAGITRVAIDVRRNTGGNSQVVDEFLRYVDVDGYLGYSGEMRWSPQAIEQRGYEGEPGYVRNRRNPKTNDPVASPPPFAGEMFVLTGKRTFSSGNWFAVILSDNGLATVVGEPTGNAPSSYGDILGFSLPESAFAYNVSFKKWLRPDPTKTNNTLLPDQLVPMTQFDVMAGRDPVLEWLKTPRR